MNKQQKIINVLNTLLSKGDVTTLQVKTELRAQYPKENWKQNEVSSVIASEASNKGISFSDNGTFRTYKSSMGTTPVSKTVVTTGTIKLPYTKLVEVIKSSKGRFFGVTFTKKDGSERTVNAQIKSAHLFSDAGYINLHTKEGLKQCSPKNIKKVSLGGSVYEIK